MGKSLHAVRSGISCVEGAFNWSVCGLYRYVGFRGLGLVKFTSDDSKVSCKNCLRSPQLKRHIAIKT